MLLKKIKRGIISFFILIPVFTMTLSTENSALYGMDSEFLYPYSVTLKLINEIILPYSPVDITTKDGYAYIICSNGSEGAITTVNIANPYTIPPIKSYNTLAENPKNITFYGPYAYVSQANGNIQVIDFKDVNKPIQQNSIDTYGNIGRMVANNGYLYFVRRDLGLTVYDITVPSFPLLKGNQIVIGSPNSVFIKNNYAYVTSETASLSIIDVSNVSNLPVVGTYNFGFTFYDIYVSDNYAYIAQGNTGVQVLDISKLPTPEWITNIFSRNSSRQVVVSGYYTWVNDENTIQAFYNKDPKQQLYAGNYDNGKNIINRLEVLDSKYIYLCSNNNKLKVILIIYNY